MCIQTAVVRVIVILVMKYLLSELGVEFVQMIHSHLACSDELARHFEIEDKVSFFYRHIFIRRHNAEQKRMIESLRSSRGVYMSVPDVSKPELTRAHS
jgi:hypothetical protein